MLIDPSGGIHPLGYIRSAMADLLAEAIASLNRARIVNYVNVGSVALVAFDFFLTLPDEIRLIWPAKWNVGKIMFFLTRYPVFVDAALNTIYLIQPNLNINLCKPLYRGAAWMSFTGITIAEVIMMMRAYAIWGQGRNVLIFLVALNLGVIIPDIILLQRSLKSLVFMPSPFPTLAPCVLASADNSVFVDFILIMVSESVVIIMTLWKCYYQWRASKSTLMKALLQDGVQYFICMFLISLANLVVVKAANVDFSALLLELQRVLHSMLSARILLHIRDAVTPDEPTAPRTMSFAVARGKPDGDSTNVELGELQSDDSSRYIRTNSSRMGTIILKGYGHDKAEKSGPLSGIHITRGTIADEELLRVGMNARTRSCSRSAYLP